MALSLSCLFSTVIRTVGTWTQMLGGWETGKGATRLAPVAARHQSRPQLSSGRISTHPVFLNLITGNQVEKINLGQNPVHEQLQPSCLLKLTSDHPTPRLKPL